MHTQPIGLKPFISATNNKSVPILIFSLFIWVNYSFEKDLSWYHPYQKKSDFFVFFLFYDLDICIYATKTTLKSNFPLIFRSHILENLWYIRSSKVSTESYPEDKNSHELGYWLIKDISSNE